MWDICDSFILHFSLPSPPCFHTLFHVPGQAPRTGPFGSGTSEMVELKDRNAALHEQIREYERTIKDQTKVK